MRKTTENIRKHYLYPSNLFVHRDEHMVTTVLGSCISVCIYDTKMKIGGINHYMLPLWNGKGLATPKFGNIAIEKLIQRLIACNCSKENMVAKVFGGANQNASRYNIGERNAQVAFDTLKEEGIRVLSHSVGGKIGRKIIFNSRTGEVMMKYISKSNL